MCGKNEHCIVTASVQREQILLGKKEQKCVNMRKEETKFSFSSSLGPTLKSHENQLKIS